MNKPNLSQFANRIRTTVCEHSPEILTGLGITGFGVAIVFAVKATPKALAVIDAEKAERARIANSLNEMQTGEEYDPADISVLDKVKLCWKYYIPTVLTAGMSTACVIGASSVSLKRNAALATAYTLSETALREYQEKVVETIGEKKEQVVRDAIAKDKVEKDPVANREVIITGGGTTRCYDAISGRYFESDMETIRKAENTLNKRMMDEMYISLNEFYWEIGLEGTDIGEQLGWRVENGLIDLKFSSQLCEDGRPCLVVDYRIAPKYCYGR